MPPMPQSNNLPAQRKWLLLFDQFYIFCTSLALPRSWHAELCQCGLGATISPPIHIVSQLLHFHLGLDLTSESFPAQPSERPLPITRAGSEVEIDLPSLLWKVHQTKPLCLTIPVFPKNILGIFCLVCFPCVGPRSTDAHKCRLCLSLYQVGVSFISWSSICLILCG